MADFGLPIYDQHRHWIRNAHVNAKKTWDEIFMGCASDENGLKTFLSNQVMMNFWKEVTCEEWRELVQLEKDAEEQTKQIDFLSGQALIFNIGEENDTRVSEDQNSAWQSDTCIQKDAFISLIKYLSKEYVNIYCGVDRKISRLRKTSRYYSDMPYNRDKDLKTAKEMATLEPTLMLMKQNGLEELGWRGAEFYWPVLVTQKDVKTVVYTSSILE